MHHAEVDAADVVAVVIDQSNDALLVRSGDEEFFVQFALHGTQVGVAVEVLGVGVAVVHVSADADRDLGMQTRFAAGFAPGVSEEATAAADDEVGDDLFVGRVVLGQRAGEEKIMGRIEKGLDVAVGVEGEALKGADFFKNRAGHDEDIFFGHGAIS